MGKERDKETAVCSSFQDSGYRGLYGRGIQEIRQKKGLRKEQNPLSHMGSIELAANLFRATQTDENYSGAYSGKGCSQPDSF